MSEEIHEPKVCAICLRPLDFIRAAGERGRYAHANEEYGPRTHVVVPVNPQEVLESIKPVCDFCFAQLGPGIEEWTIVTEPFTARVNPELVQNFSALWAACTECKTLIDRRRWSGLVSRVVNAMEVTNPATPMERKVRKAGVKMLYGKVESHFVGIRPAAASDVFERSFAPMEEEHE